MTDVDVNGGEKRQTSENRSSMIAIRVTPSEHELIRAKASSAGVSVTDLLVRAALEAEVQLPLRLMPVKVLEQRIERIERVLVDAGVILEP